MEEDADMNMGFMLKASENSNVNGIIRTFLAGMLADSFHNVGDPEIDITPEELDKFDSELDFGDEVGAPHKPFDSKNRMYV